MMLPSIRMQGLHLREFHMHAIPGEVKELLSVSLAYLNQPLIKESVKNIAGTVTFLFGLLEAYDLYRILSVRCQIKAIKSLTWMQLANKVVILCSKLSIILSASVSRPGALILSSLSGVIFSTEIECLFGLNTIFAHNPWHPRHMISIAAVILALPSAFQSTYHGLEWLYKRTRTRCFKSAQNSSQLLKPSPIEMMTLFNTLTSRPILHIGNKVGLSLLKVV